MSKSWIGCIYEYDHYNCNFALKDEEINVRFHENQPLGGRDWLWWQSKITENSFFNIFEKGSMLNFFCLTFSMGIIVDFDTFLFRKVPYCFLISEFTCIFSIKTLKVSVCLTTYFWHFHFFDNHTIFAVLTLFLWKYPILISHKILWQLMCTSVPMYRYWK